MVSNNPSPASVWLPDKAKIKYASTGQDLVSLNGLKKELHDTSDYKRGLFLIDIWYPRKRGPYIQYSLAFMNEWQQTWFKAVLEIPDKSLLTPWLQQSLSSHPMHNIASVFCHEPGMCLVTWQAPGALSAAPAINVLLLSHKSREGGKDHQKKIHWQNRLSPSDGPPRKSEITLYLMVTVTCLLLWVTEFI